jgi:hypothetical protein
VAYGCGKWFTLMLNLQVLQLDNIISVGTTLTSKLI